MMTSTLVTKVNDTTHQLHLTQDELAEIVGVSARSVARYLAGEGLPRSATKQRLLEVSYVAEQLATVFKPEDANVWLFTPNRLLGHDTPAEHIRQGDFRSVLNLVEALADGVVV